MKAQVSLYSKWQVSNGFTLIESLVALAIVSMVLYTAANVFGLVDKGTRKSRTYSTMTALESNLLAALEAPETFSKARKQMEEGTLTEFELSYLGQSLAQWKSSGPSPIFFDIHKGQPCVSTLLPGCKVRVDFALKNTSSSGDAPTWEAAYLISSVTGGEAPIASLGSGNLSNSTNIFQDDDYNLEILKAFYSNAGTSSCATGDYLAGFDPLSGKAQCWKGLPIGTRCPEGTLAKGLKFEQYSTPPPSLPNNPDLIGQLQLICKPMRKISCGEELNNSVNNEEYALHSFNPYYMDSSVPVDSEKMGKCIYMGVKEYTPNLPLNTTLSCSLPYEKATLADGSQTCRLPENKEKIQSIFECPKDHVFSSDKAECVPVENQEGQQ